ncbi:potassium/proton antiporter RosB [Anopheles sinensis]|uniref:Potassium/proton antiporter RosB n=1 Tax=Anopheles sinensis TaxID=74873 RepID=A0A084VJ60_ANOSI|nr:potassium/proton antiporter RosB [Anopheles sinensis]
MKHPRRRMEALNPPTESALGQNWGGAQANSFVPLATDRTFEHGNGGASIHHNALTCRQRASLWSCTGNTAEFHHLPSICCVLGINHAVCPIPGLLESPGGLEIPSLKRGLFVEVVHTPTKDSLLLPADLVRIIGSENQ